MRGKRIKIVEFTERLGAWSFAQRGIKNNFIFINKCRRGAKRKELMGQFAHELCHLVLDHIDKSFVGDIFHNYFKKFPSYFFDTGFSRRIERGVDKEVIRRGYARELVEHKKEFRKIFNEKVLKGLRSRGYLDEDAIKSYAKEIGKW